MSKLVCAKVVLICFSTNSVYGWDNTGYCNLFWILDNLIGGHSIWYFIVLWKPDVFSSLKLLVLSFAIILWRCVLFSFQIISVTYILRILAPCSHIRWKHFLQLFICLLNCLWDLEVLEILIFVSLIISDVNFQNQLEKATWFWSFTKRTNLIGKWHVPAIVVLFYLFT